MVTKDTLSGTVITALIQGCRQRQEMSLREFGNALGVSHMQVRNFEKGIAAPDNERLLSWTRSETPWIKQLGQEIFAARYVPFVEALLRSAGAYAAKRVPG